MGLEPIITQLKRLVLYQFSYKANPLCFHAESNCNPKIKSLLDYHYPMEALPKPYSGLIYYL